MIRSDWNALAVGDEVLVHDPPFPPTPATSGKVTLIKVHGRGINEVAIRLVDGGRLVWPPLTSVHREAHPGGPSCWRCEELAVPSAEQ